MEQLLQFLHMLPPVGGRHLATCLANTDPQSIIQEQVGADYMHCVHCMHCKHCVHCTVLVISISDASSGEGDHHYSVHSALVPRSRQGPAMHTGQGGGGVLP